MRQLLALVLSALCFSAAAQPREVERPPLDEIGQQHLYVLSVSAWFYCENGRWPEKISEALAYRSAKRILDDVKLHEAWLSGPELNYSSSPSYSLISRSFYSAGGWINAKSKQSPPKCGEKDTELQGANVSLRVEPKPAPGAR